MPDLNWIDAQCHADDPAEDDRSHAAEVEFCGSAGEGRQQVGMSISKCLWLGAVWAMVYCGSALGAEAVSIEGAPADTGFNVGSTAEINAELQGVSTDPSRYAVFAEIQYVGTTAVASVQMDRENGSAELRYKGGWPIPSDSPTGLYSVKLRVEDRQEHRVVASREVRGFAAYKKLL